MSNKGWNSFPRSPKRTSEKASAKKEFKAAPEKTRGIDPRQLAIGDLIIYENQVRPILAIMRSGSDYMFKVGDSNTDFVTCPPDELMDIPDE